MEDFFDEEDEKPEEKPKEEREDFSGLLNKIKLYLLEYYEPVFFPQDAELHYTTREIWKQLLKLFPNEWVLTEDLVANWLHNGGFTFYDFGDMNFEWIMKRKNICS